MSKAVSVRDMSQPGIFDEKDAVNRVWRHGRRYSTEIMERGFHAEGSRVGGC